MKYTSIIKRETKVMVLMVVALLGLVLGVSYAMFMDVKDNTNNQIVRTGTLQVEYSSSNGYLNGEVYDDIKPMSDSEGLEQAGYTFSVTNTGNIPTSYQVYLYVNEEDYQNDVYDGEIEDNGLFTDIESIKYNLITNGESNETVTKISSVDSITEEETNIKKYLLYTGTLANTNDSNIHSLKLWLDPEDMDTEYIGKYIYLKLQVNNYVSGQEEKSPICRRATELHTETCEQTDPSLYCSGSGYVEGNKGTIITYGNLGTRGTLTSGDAFDCDVNGDGIYNTGNERFYYVSNYYNTETKEFENDTAVLIYYGNKYSDNTSDLVSAYYSLNENWHGPEAIIENLPTIEQWKNVKLKKSTRTILNELNGNYTTGGTLPTAFNYEGKMARLLTYQEIVQACGEGDSIQTGYLNNCNYFLENTKYSSDTKEIYGYWLETPNSNSSTIIYGTSGNFNSLYNGDFNFANSNKIGVRPVIEVPKARMSY